MNTERKQAEQKYKQAVTAEKAAEMGTDERAYVASVEATRLARRALVELEIAFPTLKEMKKKNETLRLANMGVNIYG